MIIEIYAVLTAVYFLLLILGYQYDAIIFKIVGFSIMFIVNSAIIVSGIDYSTGVISVYNNVTLTTTATNIYTSEGTHWIGFLMMVIGLFGTTWATYEEKKPR